MPLFIKTEFIKKKIFIKFKFKKKNNTRSH